MMREAVIVVWAGSPPGVVALWEISPAGLIALLTIEASIVMAFALLFLAFVLWANGGS